MPQELIDYTGKIKWSAKYPAYGNLAALHFSELTNSVASPEEN
ncbi:hypothetical protein ABIA54_000311 [Pseudomonas sp. EB276 TE3739]|nr:hypothetical protein [Pseudomonas koreensis]